MFEKFKLGDGDCRLGLSGHRKRQTHGENADPPHWQGPGRASEAVTKERWPAMHTDIALLCRPPLPWGRCAHEQRRRPRLAKTLRHASELRAPHLRATQHGSRRP
jgi:hypothetical protein